MSQRQGSSQQQSSGPGASGEAKGGVRRTTIKSRARSRVHGDQSDSSGGSAGASDRPVDTASAATSDESRDSSAGDADAADGSAAGARDHDGSDASSSGKSEAPTAAQRFQVVELEGRKKAHLLSADNLSRMQLVPAMLLDIVEEVTNGKMAFDLRGKLREVHIVFDDKDMTHSLVSMVTEGHAHQAFHIQLGGKDDGSSASGS